MNTGLFISIFGALSAITVSILGAFLANRNSITLQIRKLKEEHYIAYIEAIHDLAAENENIECLKNYVSARDKLFIIASEDVIKKIITFENEGVDKKSDLYDKFLTDLIKSIRTDLKLKDKDFPQVYFKKWEK